MAVFLVYMQWRSGEVVEGVEGGRGGIPCFGFPQMQK
jgi:hypothetical protein